MKRNRIDYKTALSLSAIMTLTIHLLFLIMYFFGRSAIMPPDAPARPHHELDLYHILFSLSSNFIVLFSIFLLNFKILKSSIRYKWATIITGSLVTLIILNLIFGTIQFVLFSYEEVPPARAIVGRMIGECFIGMIVVFISQIVYLSVKRQETELENKELNAENMKSRYEALKNQIDPHFLFNTLSSLTSMIEIDPAKAQEYVIQLSSVFRYTLQRKEVVTLEEELKFTKDYCHLMQIRYGDSLSFYFNVDEKYINCYVVPLSIQTLVENAIKHNVISKRDPLEVLIETQDEGFIRVSNPLQKKAVPEGGEGIGLANLGERYRLKWGKEINITSKDDTFQVSIPLIPHQHLNA